MLEQAVGSIGEDSRVQVEQPLRALLEARDTL